MTDHPRHEGYVVPEFGDGQHGRDITVAGIPPDQIIVSLEYDGDRGRGSRDIRAAVRPAADVIGWRVCCHCGDEGGVPPWQAVQLLLRVTTPELEDVAKDRIHSPDADVVKVPQRADVRHRARALWWRHVSGAEALVTIDATCRDNDQAKERLGTAVAEARASGVSWQAIGRAAGMSRQSAHARWGGLPRSSSAGN